MSGWDQISEDLFLLIHQRLPLPIRLGFVCTSWRSLSAPLIWHAKLPWLMLPYRNREHNGRFGFFSLYNRRIYKFELPELAGTQIYGCSLGCLITVHKKNSRIHLLHPFTRERIELPSLSTFPGILSTSYSKKRGLIYEFLNTDGKKIEYNWWEMYESYRGKFCLSSSPTSSLDCIVMAIHGLDRKLAFCRPGDNEWTTVKTPLEIDYDRGYTDIFYYNRQFCALDYDRRVSLCDLGSSPAVTKILPSSTMYKFPEWEYLVDSAGELLRVSRDVRWLTSAEEWKRTKINRFKYEFEVYKFDLELQRWIKVKTLGDNVLFLSNSVSLALPACHCLGDRIYFVDDGCGSYEAYGREVYSLWVFNMVDGNSQICFQSDCLKSMPVPFWVAT